MIHLLHSDSARRVALIALIIVYIVLGFNTQLTTLSRVNPPRFMEDYDIFIQAFRHAASGEDPYAIRQTGLQFLYPPPSFFVFGIYGLIQPDQLQVAIYLLSNLVALAAMLVWVGFRYGYTLRKTWWWFPLAFCFAPFLELLYVGQINLITEFGILLMFIFAARLSAIAGLGLGLAVVTKLTPLAYFAYLTVARNWRALGWTVAILLISFIASTLVFGADLLVKFFQVFSGLQTTFYGEYDSQALIPILIARGGIEQGTWLLFQNNLNYYGVVLCLASAALAWRSRQAEPFFIILGFATTVIPSNLWYNRYVLLLLPIFVWMAWSRFNLRVVAWCLTGLLIAQIDRPPFARGLLNHLFAHATLAAILGWQFREAFREKAPQARPVLIGFGLALALIIAFPLQNALALNANLIAADDWVNANLPSGARIAYDATAPPIRDGKFTADMFPALVAQSPDWYERNGYEYLVFSSATFSPALQDRSSESSKQYAAFFDRFRPVGHIQNGDHEIRIYQTNPTRLPAHRDSQHFGIFAEWLEFVGYDLEFPRFQFYWRVVQPRRESITVTVRLLDRMDQLVDQVDAILFPSEERWRQEIVTSPVHLSSSHPAGIYKIELELEGRVSGAIPVLSAADEYVSDSLVISPIKVPPTPPTQSQLDSARLSNARFGSGILLSRFAIDSQNVSPSQPLKLRLYWMSESNVDVDYTIFLHLVDAQENLIAQMDSPPQGGSYPTSDWQAGELIPDLLELVIARDLPTGTYRVELGMYGPNLSRLKITDSNGKPIGDHMLLDSIVVR